MVGYHAGAKADQTITFAPLTDKIFGDAPFSVSATASSGLVVSFAATGNCSVASTTVTLTGAGSCTVTASQAGDANYNPAADVSRTFAIGETSALFLHSSGSTLFLDAVAPGTSPAKFRDSASLTFAGGNPWKEIGTWSRSLLGSLTALADLHVWLGLRNSDDTGTRFDLRAEVLKDGALVTFGEAFCITGVTRNPDLAKEVVVALGAPGATQFNGTLSLRVLTRIGSNGSGAFCGGHSNAAGLRMYFDGTDRPARFGTTVFPP